MGFQVFKVFRGQSIGVSGFKVQGVLKLKALGGRLIQFFWGGLAILHSELHANLTTLSFRTRRAGVDSNPSTFVGSLRRG